MHSCLRPATLLPDLRPPAHGAGDTDVDGRPLPRPRARRVARERLTAQLRHDALAALDRLRTPDGWLTASAADGRFASLFGRDALVSALAVLPLDPSIADATLAALGAHLGTRDDPEREEEPGKVAHEVRDADLDLYVEHGWPVRNGRLEYYGSVDASVWWLIVYAALARGGHDVRGHRDAAVRVASYLAAGSTPLVYRRRAWSGGLAHHWWRDVAADLVATSRHGMFRDDGAPMAGTVGVAAAQALAWRALHEAAEVLDRELTTSADAARRAFVAHYVHEGRIAFARDDAGLAAAATSDLGFVLWTGILDDRDADRATEALLSDDLRTPHGVRTLPASHPAFTPSGYHSGAVWPWDNWFVTSGIAERAPDESASIAASVLHAVTVLGFTELYGVSLDGELLASVESCPTQAWTVGAVLAWLEKWNGRAWEGAAVPNP